MLEILVIIFTGVLAGVITGLTPGIHPNTVIFALIPFYFNLDIDFILFAGFISGLSVSHTFHDFIPSIFMGVPDPASALSALPGQKMALRGRGLEAFNMTVYGGIYAMLVAVLSSGLLYLFLDDLYAAIESYMFYSLLFVLSLIVFKSDSEFNSFIVAILSGALGVISFSAPVNQQYVLTPVFGGLFAFPALLQGIKAEGKVPEQFSPDKNYSDHRLDGALGFLASIPIVIFPGLSSSVATTFLYPVLRSRERFLAAVGGVNTSDIFLSFVTLLVMDRARSGASVAISMTGNAEALMFVLGTSLVAIGFTVPMAFLSVSLFLRSGILRRQKLLSLLIFFLLVAVSAYLTGPIGLLIFATASCIGCFASLNSDRHSCMAVLLLPSMMFFAGSGMFM